MGRRAASGRTLVELLAALAVAAWFLATVTPAAREALQRYRLRGASQDLRTRLRQARLLAVLTHRRHGVVFERGDGYRYATYRDGNGNGIRRDDIDRGIDVMVDGPHRTGDRHRGVEVAILVPPPVPRIPPESGDLERLDDPVRFGSADVVSYSPAGDSSSGTIYLSLGRSRLAAVRVRGSTGRVTLWEYDPARGAWAER